MRSRVARWRSCDYRAMTRRKTAMAATPRRRAGTVNRTKCSPEKNPPMKIPRALYRLQFSPTFGFAAAKEIVPYLSQLGISDIYAAPIFMARAGSTHGYDIVDPNRLNPELGSADELAALMESVRRHDMGWIQDIVPNHMAYDGENQWLMDVLENGPASEYADYFDIHWNHPDESIKARVLAPFLAASYGECLERGEIRLGYDRGGLNVR